MSLLMIIFLISSSGILEAKSPYGTRIPEAKAPGGCAHCDSMKVVTTSEPLSGGEVYSYSFGTDDYSVGFNKTSISTNTIEENINIASGKVNLKIKLLSLPMRGGKDYDLYITYRGSPLSLLEASYTDFLLPYQGYGSFGCAFDPEGYMLENLWEDDFTVSSDMGNCGLGWNIMPGEVSLTPNDLMTKIPCCGAHYETRGFINLNDAGNASVYKYMSGGPTPWIVEEKLDWTMDDDIEPFGVELCTPGYTYIFGDQPGTDPGEYESYTEYPISDPEADQFALDKRTIYLLSQMVDNNGNYINFEWSGDAEDDENTLSTPSENYSFGGCLNYPPPAARVPKKICAPTDTCYFYRRTIEPDTNERIRLSNEAGGNDPFYCLWNFYVIDSIVNIVNGERFKIKFHYHQEWLENTMEFWYGRQFLFLDSIEFLRDGQRIKPPYRFSYAVNKDDAPELLPGELSGFQIPDGAQYEYEYKTMEYLKEDDDDGDGEHEWNEHHHLTQYRAIDKKTVTLPETGSQSVYTYTYEGEPELKDASVGPKCPKRGVPYVPPPFYEGLFAQAYTYYPIYKKCEVKYPPGTAEIPEHAKTDYFFVDSVYIANHLRAIDRTDECCEMIDWLCGPDWPQLIKPDELEGFYGKPYKIIEYDARYGDDFRKEITLYFWGLGNAVTPSRIEEGKILHPVLRYKLFQNLYGNTPSEPMPTTIMKAYEYKKYDKYGNKMEYEFLGDVIYDPDEVYDEDVYINPGSSDPQHWRNKNLPDLEEITTEDNWKVETVYLYQDQPSYYDNSNFCHLPFWTEKYKHPYTSSDLVSKTQLLYDMYSIDGMPSGSSHMCYYTASDDIRGNVSRKIEYINDIGTRTEKYKYDACGNLRKVTDYMNNEYKYTYVYFAVFPNTKEYPDGSIEDFDFDKKGRLVKVTDKNGIVSKFDYDIYGRLTEYRKGIPGDLYRLGLYEYYDFERWVRACSYYSLSNADVTFYYYDELGRLEESKRSSMISEDIIKEYFYDDNGNMIRETVPRFENAVEPHYAVEKEFDYLGNVIEIEYPSYPYSEDEYVEYFYEGDITEIIDEEGYETTLKYDASGNLDTVIDARGNYTYYYYDVNGNLNTIIDAEGKETTFKYDFLGNLVKRKGPDRGVDTFAYDANGNTIYHMNNSGDEIEFEYDILDRIENKLVNSQVKESYYYDGYDNIGGDNYENDIPSGLNYPVGRLTGFQNADMREVYFYDKFGNIGEKLIIPLTGSVDEQTIKYSYDLKGRLTRLDYPGYKVEYDYDNFDNISLVEINDDKTVNLSSTATGLLSGVYFPGGVTDTFQYEPRSWMDSMKISKGSNLYWRDFKYNKRGELTGEWYAPNNASIEADYTYDELGRLTNEDREGTENDHSFTYDAVGNRDVVDGTIEYEYETGTNKLIDIDNGSYTYTYNDIGCISSKNNVVDGLTNFYYDSEGRLTLVEFPDEEDGYMYYYKGSQRIREEKITDIVHTQTQTLTSLLYSCKLRWDGISEALLEMIFLDENNNEIDTLTLYSINNFGAERISGEVTNFPLGTVNAKLRARRWPGHGAGDLWVDSMSIDALWDVADPISSWTVVDGEERNYFYDDAGNLIMVDDDNETTPPIRYIYAGNRLLAKEEDGDLHFYHLDRIGSPIMITDEGGNVVREKKYEAFGNLIWAEGDYEDNREFTGKEKDPTGLHYFLARYYSGDIGRFLRPDPIVLHDLTNPQTLNPYVYCANNPLRYLDPDGLDMVGIGEDRQQDLDDLSLVAGEDADRLSFDKDDKLVINKEGYKGGNKGLDFLIKIVESKKIYGYGADKTNIINKKNIDLKGRIVKGAIKSLSTTHRYKGMGILERTMPHENPPKGFDGIVKISVQAGFETAKGVPVDRWQVIGHEIVENYYRTDGGMNYFDAHDAANKYYYGDDVNAVPLKSK